MKKRTFLNLLCLTVALTACGQKTEIPPVDLIEIPITTTITTSPQETTVIPSETTALTETETTTIATSSQTDDTISPTETTESDTAPATEIESPETDEDSETEDTTEAKPKNTAWVKAYRRILVQHCRDKQEEETSETDTTNESDSDEESSSRKKDDETEEIENQWFVLIYLDDDKIPEMVILDGTDMELYCFDGKNAQLLLEDSYKSDAFDQQNVCYQPYTGYIASAFTTMSGGDGFTIYHFDQLDAVHVQRYYFNNNENVEGEMAYNEIWNRAEEFEVIDNGYHDVTLGDSWTHVTSEMDGAYRLTLENANTLTADLAPDIEKDSEQDPTEDETEEEE
ncbi:MAG TPA: hypothetical protein DCO72_00470 [Ruminococcus sp.]|nr:hypothetical protein [Ruminococcus sp.]